QQGQQSQSPEQTGTPDATALQGKGKGVGSGNDNGQGGEANQNRATHHVHEAWGADDGPELAQPDQLTLAVLNGSQQDKQHGQGQKQHQQGKQGNQEGASCCRAYPGRQDATSQRGILHACVGKG